MTMNIGIEKRGIIMALVHCRMVQTVIAMPLIVRVDKRWTS